MVAHSFNFAKVFANGGDIHYILPHFQREYRWEEKHWRTLWDDAIQTYDALPEVSKAQRPPEHFLGAVVVVPDGSTQGSVAVHRLVDGQQRLITISLLLLALSKTIKSTHPDLSRRIRRMLINQDVKGNVRFKVLPTTKNNDRDVYCAIIEDKHVPDGLSHIPDAYDFYEEHLQLAFKSGRIEPESFFKVLVSAFQVVWVELNKDENAYQIFESLNTKGERLKEVDLVRNYIAMRLPTGEQERIFFDVWAPIEALLNDENEVGRSGIGELTAFLRHYDAMKTGVLPSERNIYARFRDEMKALDDDEFIEELTQLKKLASLYDGLLRPDKGSSPALSDVLNRLRSLEISTSLPFLLAVSAKHDEGSVPEPQFIGICTTIENYLFRRFLAGEKSNYLNRVFPALVRDMDWTNPQESLRALIVKKAYPSDEDIRRFLLQSPIGEKFNKRPELLTVLNQINLYLSQGSGGYTSLSGKATLEHIFPQHPSSDWKQDVGDDWEEMLEVLLHSIGNLTFVTGDWNSSLSNSRFISKKDKLAQHALKLNADYFARQIPVWNADAVRERATYLTDKILDIWPSLQIQANGQATSKRATPTPPPKSISVRGQKQQLKSWADALRATGEILITQGVDFDDLQKKFPYVLKSIPYTRGNYQLSNGVHMTTNFNQATISAYIKAMMEFCGVNDEDWSIETN